MAIPLISSLPSIGFTLTLPDNATAISVDDITYGAFAQDVPGNCESVIVYNMSGANRLFAKWGSITSGKISSNMTISNSTVIPAGASFTFEIGLLGERQSIGDRPESTVNLFLKLEGGVNQTVNITYMMGKPKI